MLVLVLRFDRGTEKAGRGGGEVVPVLRVEVGEKRLGVMDLGTALNEPLVHLESGANRVELAEVVGQWHVAVRVGLGVFQGTGTCAVG